MGCSITDGSMLLKLSLLGFCFCLCFYLLLFGYAFGKNKHAHPANVSVNVQCYKGGRASNAFLMVNSFNGAIIISTSFLIFHNEEVLVSASHVSGAIYL